jgi:hypothetical protein
MQKTIFILLSALITTACRPEPGTPDYPDITDDTGDIDGGLPGDAPWDGSSPRLSYGVFYEGGYTDALIIDNATINYYIYENTYTQADAEEHVEGFTSDRLIIINDALGFWGGGVHFDGMSAQDLSSWTTLHAALKSDNAEMEAFELGMVGGTEGRVSVTDYGFVADGEWHVVNIPLSDLGVSLDQVTVGLLLIGTTAVNDTAILIDDLYLTAEEAK